MTSPAVHSLASVSYSSLTASASPFRLLSSVGPSTIFCQTTCPEQQSNHNCYSYSMTSNFFFFLGKECAKLGLSCVSGEGDVGGILPMSF